MKILTNNKVCYLLCVFIFCIFSVIVFSLFFNYSAQTALAEQSVQSYRLKLELADKTYWIKSDGTLSLTTETLTVGENFNLDSFKNRVANNEGFLPGKYIAGFKFKNSGNECVFANNIVLSIGSEQEYVIVPIYENEIYSVIFTFDQTIDYSPMQQSFVMGDFFSVNNPVCEGYTFDGWYYENGSIAFSDNVVPDLSQGVAVSNSTLTIMGKMRPNAYTVSFLIDEVNNIYETRTVYYKGLVQNIPPAKDIGYEFLYYTFSSEYGLQERFYVGDNYNWIYPQSATLIPVRKNTPTQYNITYNENGGSLSNITIYTYDVTNLPLKLNVNGYYEYDELIGFSISGTETPFQIVDTIPCGTVGNLTLTATWKAKRYSSSNKFSISSEIYGDALTIVNCENISQFSLRIIEIEPSVDEIYFLCDFSKMVLSKKIIVQERSTPLTIHIKNMKWVSFGNSALIDATACPNLTLHCIGENKLFGGGVFGTDQDQFLAVVMIQNLVISGDKLEISASGGMNGANGEIGLFAGVKNWAEDPIHLSVIVTIEIDQLTIKGGNGSMGSEDYPIGGNGGSAIVCFAIIIIDNHENQRVTLLGGDGGANYNDESKGAKADDVIGILNGDYIGSDDSE